MYDVKKAMLLYAVTDRSWTGSQTLLQQVEAALKGGVTCVQLREKDMGYEEFLQEALEIKELCHRYGVPFLVNDRVDLALRCDADGVHVGQSDTSAEKARALLGPDRIVGVTARTVEQAKAAQAAGASYLGSGAVFGSTTKEDAMPLNHAVLKRITEAVSIPVVAIGGITEENLPRLHGTGVDGVAMVSTIFSAPDIENKCRELKDLSQEMVKP